MTIHPHEKPVEEMVSVEIAKADLDRLNWLLAVLRNIDGWCRVNRQIGKYLIVAVLAGAVFLWKGVEAMSNLAAWVRGH